MDPQRDKKRPFPQKALMLHSDPVTLTNKGLSEYQRKARQVLYRALPPWRQRSRHVTARAGRARGYCNIDPRDYLFHQTVNRLSVATQVFRGSWTADICQGMSQPEISFSEETQGPPGTVLLLPTQKTNLAKTGEE